MKTREVQSSLRQLTSSYNDHKRNPEAKNVNSLKDTIRNIRADLDELNETIKIVSSNPVKFKLDRRQVDERKDFVVSVDKTLSDMSAYLSSNQANPANPLMNNNKPNPLTNKSQRDQLLTSKTDKSEPPKSEKVSNTRFVEQESQAQELMMRDQDAQLEDVAITVGNLKEIARVMGDELDDQTRLLGEVEQEVDSTTNKLADGFKRMGDFIKANSDNKQQCCVIVLIIVLIIMIVLVVYL